MGTAYLLSFARGAERKGGSPPPAGGALTALLVVLLPLLILLFSCTRAYSVTNACFSSPFLHCLPVLLLRCGCTCDGAGHGWQCLESSAAAAWPCVPFPWWYLQGTVQSLKKPLLLLSRCPDLAP